MSFAATYSTVLAPFVKKFQVASNEKERKTVVNVAVAAVKKSKALLEDGDPLPKDLPTVRLGIFFGIIRLINNAPGCTTLLDGM
jgi:hypothetical protein